MSLPTRATTAVSTVRPTALPGDLAGTLSRGAGPAFSALLDMHAQATSGVPSKAPGSQSATARAARPAAPPAPQKSSTPTPVGPPASQQGASESAGEAKSGSAPYANSAAAKTAAAAYQARQAADKEAARAVDARGHTRSAVDTSAADDTPATTEARLQAQADASSSPADAALQAWLGWQAPTDRAQGPAGSWRAAGELDAATLAQDASATLEGTGSSGRGRHGSGKDDEGQGSLAGLDPRSDAAGLLALHPGAGLATLFDEDKAVATGSTEGTHDGTGAALEPLGTGQPLPHAPAEARSTLASAPPASVDLGTGPGQVDFAETFALQVSQLAQDGVQEATLHLNPADLGSIAVQISVDAGQAQVDFSASSAHTRELLGSQLEMLALALQQAGLSMTGGQVRDPSQGGAQDARQPPSGRGSSGGQPQAGDAAPTVASTRTVQVAAGRLDLFA